MLSLVNCEPPPAGAGEGSRSVRGIDMRGNASTALLRVPPSSTGSVWPWTARCLPFETSPPGPLSRTGEGEEELRIRSFSPYGRETREEVSTDPRPRSPPLRLGDLRSPLPRLPRRRVGSAGRRAPALPTLRR